MKTHNYKYWEKRITREIEKEWRKSEKFLPCHGPSHHIRVWKNAEKFGRQKKADLEILVACCLLHDIVAYNKTPIKNHDLASAKIAKRILKKLNYPKDKAEVVYQIISTHTSRKKQLGELEGRIMSSFDKIDAFGPIGIYRIITPMVIRGYSMETIVRWFGEGKKLQRKWQSVKFSEIRKKYHKDYLYTVNFFKQLAKYK